MHRRIRKEEHIRLIREPGGQYVGHVTPASGICSDIAKCNLKYLEDYVVGINELEAIGCDGTATNTGWKNGVIRNIELKIQRRLQWFICLPYILYRDKCCWPHQSQNNYNMQA
ncbi:hypothetical protein AVEN_4089-1 [Araneus ventricosus]|uniref:Uncharacterized protein n=1 Tax=Araneus ventricosus TaxID=182803 RepID=A0A4Y2IW96_ARAVE|nr:hypothetical protein AVEN_4089-1 [Araneus ventricosus]